MALKIQGLKGDGTTWFDLFQVEESVGKRHEDIAAIIIANLLINGWTRVRLVDGNGIIQEEGKPLRRQIT